MVKSTGTGPAGSSMSLKDVVKEIKETNKKLDAQGTALTDFIAELKFQRGTQGLENKREANTKGKGKGSGIPLLSPIANLNKEGLGLGIFIGSTLLERNYAKITCRNSITRNGAEVIIKWKNKDLIGL